MTQRRNDKQHDRQPNKAPEPTAVVAVSSASRFTVIGRLWLSFHTLDHSTTMKRFWLMFMLLIVVMLVIGYIAAWHTSLGRSLLGVSSLRFTNRSGHTVEIARMYFYYTDKYDSFSYRQEFHRYFTNLPPNTSVVVRYRTPQLILWAMVGRVSPYDQDTFNFNDTAGDKDVIAKPGPDTVVSLDARGYIKRDDEH